jgi:hypothetical protein
LNNNALDGRFVASFRAKKRATAATRQGLFATLEAQKTQLQ